MAQVSEWLRNVVVAIILAGFLEMLLPNNELKSVTKMIMGLIVMMVLLQPLIKFFDLPQTISLSLPSISEPESNPQTQQIINRGLKMRADWTKGTREKNRAMLEGKIKNIIGLIDEVQLEEIKLDFQEDDYPIKACLKLKSLKWGTLQAETVKKVDRKVIDSIQFITDLREDQIEVSWDDGR
jgi:stage III sporulation protein AF